MQQKEQFLKVVELISNKYNIDKKIILKIIIEIIDELLDKKRKTVGYDFDGVLHRSMSSYEIKMGSYYQGHPDFQIDTKLYIPNRLIIKDMEKHINKGDNVYIISRNPRKKMEFIKRVSSIIYDYFIINPEKIIVAGKEGKIKHLRENNINKFVEDSTIELHKIHNAKLDIELYFVPTYRSYLSDPLYEPNLEKYTELVVRNSPERSVKIMTYNIDWQTEQNSNKKKNVITNILQADPDIVCFQEAKYLLYEPDITNKYEIEYGINNPAVTIIGWKSSKFTMVDKKYEIKKSINHGQTFDTRRPLCAIKLKNNITDEINYIIGVHLGHHLKRPRAIELITESLVNLKYSAGERVFFLGDCNELYEDSPTLKTTGILDISTYSPLKLNLYQKPPLKTCCYSSYHGGFDLIFDSFKNSIKTVTNQPTHNYSSDHKPIIAEFKQTLHSVYLVPFDYDGPSEPNFEKWGGYKPHITLLSYQQMNMEDISQSIKGYAVGLKTKRWTFGKSRKIDVQKHGKNNYLHFKSGKLDNLRLIFEKIGLITKTDYHISTITSNLLTFITKIQNCKDWKLVITTKYPDDVVKWIINFDFYD